MPMITTKKIAIRHMQNECKPFTPKNKECIKQKHRRKRTKSPIRYTENKEQKNRNNSLFYR